MRFRALSLRLYIAMTENTGESPHLGTTCGVRSSLTEPLIVATQSHGHVTRRPPPGSLTEQPVYLRSCRPRHRERCFFQLRESFSPLLGKNLVAVCFGLPSEQLERGFP